MNTDSELWGYVFLLSQKMCKNNHELKLNSVIKGEVEIQKHVIELHRTESMNFRSKNSHKYLQSISGVHHGIIKIVTTKLISIFIFQHYGSKEQTPILEHTETVPGSQACVSWECWKCAQVFLIICLDENHQSNCT